MSSLQSRIDESAQAIESKVIGWFRDLHANPELSNREQRTTALIADHLRAIGIDEVRTDENSTGVVGVLRGGGVSAHGSGGSQVMGLRADIDALPVKEQSPLPYASTVVDHDYPGGPFPVSHACGHDAHTAMLMGAAEVLAGVRDELPGTVVFVFQPAEEGAPIGEDAGAAHMIRNGAIADPVPGMFFGVHVVPLPIGVLGYAIGNGFAASEIVKIKIQGAGTHGSTPWMGRDPLPVAAEIINASAQVYRQIPTAEMMTISFGHIEDTGRFNIISDTVTVFGTVRAIRLEVMETINQKLELLAQGIAQASGCTAEVEFLQKVPPVHNSQQWLDRIVPTAERVMGQGRVIKAGPVMGYDDVSEFIDASGGAYMLLGCQDSEFNLADESLAPREGGRGVWPNHNPQFYVDESILTHGVRLHSHITTDFLTGTL